MMTARHLVRRLLELRRSGSEPIQFGLNIGNGDRGQAQTANDAQFRRAVSVFHGNGETEIHHAVSDAQLSEEVGKYDADARRLSDGECHITNLHGFPGHVGLLGQSGFPQQKIELGQQCNLSSQSLNTVSGFWVAFKRKPAPQPSQSEAAA